MATTVSNRRLPNAEASRTGMWIGLAAITMSFVAFTSAMLVRRGTSSDWQHIAVPAILFPNTFLLVASTGTLEITRRRIASFMGGVANRGILPTGWLYATLVMGVVFLVGQCEAWLQLRSQGFYLPTNPGSSFFYLLTAIHGLHLLGGIGGLIAVIRKLQRGGLRRSTLDATSHYWHFMSILWLYLLLLIWMKF